MINKSRLIPGMIIIFFFVALAISCGSDEKKIDEKSIIRLLDNKEYDRASAEIEMALKSDPECSFCYFAQGYILQQQGQRSEAVNNYNKAIELSPETPQYYYYRGRLNVNRGLLQGKDFNKVLLERDTRSAIDDFTKGIELKPGKIDEYYHERGSAYITISEYSRALADFQKILQMNKKDTPLLCNIGKCYLKLNDPDKALEFMLQAKSDEITNDFCAVNIALAYSMKNEKEKAVEYLKLATDKNSFIAKYGISDSDPGWDNIRKTETFRKLKKWK